MARTHSVNGYKIGDKVLIDLVTPLGQPLNRDVAVEAIIKDLPPERSKEGGDGKESKQVCVDGLWYSSSRIIEQVL